ncbi:MAG: ATP-binding protein [Acidaminococcaceae bacterium]|nr:ATP-binding protein [Acidaminococcaceae bacterium]
MNDIALHILDIIQNSLAAGASVITLYINEDLLGFLVFSVEDNGKGMSEEMVQQVCDPFVTTRTTRKVGMGLPLLSMTTSQSGGTLSIKSKLGQGTTVRATFCNANVDRPPLGDVVKTIIILLVGNPQVRLIVHYGVGTYSFTYDTQEIQQVLGLKEVDYSVPELTAWVREYLTQEITKVREEGEKK